MNSRKCIHAMNLATQRYIEAGTSLVDRIMEEKKKRWEEVMTSIDLRHTSRKAWKTIKNLSNGQFVAEVSFLFFTMSGQLQPGLTPTTNQQPMHLVEET